MKTFRREHDLSSSDVKHEIVNHSKGELKNSSGFTTNPIECKRSLIKRWIRARNAGRLPTHSDRHKWRVLVNEYQARNILKAKAPQSFDYGHITSVQSSEILTVFCCD